MMSASHSASSSQLSARIITSEREWDAIRQDWDSLFSACPAAATTLDFTWLRLWWLHYGATYGCDRLRIITVWRDSQLIAILPLYISCSSSRLFPLRVLRFVSTGEAECEETCPDYLGFLCVPGEEEPIALYLWGAIINESWDRLELLNLTADSPLLHMKGSIIQSMVDINNSGTCPVAELTQGFDAYVARLSAKTRQHARQYLRAFARHGALFQLASTSDVPLFFDDLVRLHQERWNAEGKAGVFASPRFTEFHRDLLRQWVPKGRAVVARLSHNGTAYAVLYGFVTGAKFDFYQSGIKHTNTGPFESPGTTANLLLMSHLAATRGVTHYDFLRGSSSYKQRLATTETRLVSIRSSRPTLRAAISRTLSGTYIIARKGIRIAFRGRR
jgi:CelD/BcsL family acetyltransferase involved in cellulose biosynthesis